MQALPFMNKKYDAIIFDLDGTLYDFRHVVRHLIFQSPLDMFTMKADRDVRKEMKGCDFASEEDFYAEYGKRMALRTKKSASAVTKWFLEKYTKVQMPAVLRRFYSPRDGLESFLKELVSQGIKLAVFSDYPAVKERLKALGFSNKAMSLLSGTYCAQQFGCLKPAARPFICIAREMGVSPQRCLVVGDRDDTDGQGARAASMPFVQIKSHKTKVLDSNHPLMSWEDFAKSFAREKVAESNPA